MFKQRKACAGILSVLTACPICYRYFYWQVHYVQAPQFWASSCDDDLRQLFLNDSILFAGSLSAGPSFGHLPLDDDLPQLLLNGSFLFVGSLCAGPSVLAIFPLMMTCPNCYRTKWLLICRCTTCRPQVLGIVP
jgi:hypothetical protein